MTAWTLLVDAGIISALLLIGKILRAKVRFIQKLFIPPSLLAGFAGLVFGPELLGWLPLSENMGTYAGILIALVFSTLPLTSGKQKAKGNSPIGRMWSYSQAGMLLQWGLGAALGLCAAAWMLSAVIRDTAAAMQTMIRTTSVCFIIFLPAVFVIVPTSSGSPFVYLARSLYGGGQRLL